MFNWDAFDTEIRGFLVLVSIAAAAWLIAKVAKGDVSGAARMLGAGVIALLALGLIFIMAAPDTAAGIVDQFVG